VQTPTSIDLKKAVDSALALHRQGRPAEALDRLRRIHASVPDDPAIRFLMGAMHSEQGDPKAAVPHLAAALESRPDHAQAAALLGQAYRQLGDDDAAVAMWRAYLTANPGDLRARLNLIEALFHRGDRDEAEASVAALPPEAEQDPDTQLILGLVYHATGNPEAGLTRYRRCLELRPGQPLARRNTASALQALGRLDEAESIYRDLLEATPGDVELIRNLGTIQKDRDDLAGAVDLYGQAMRLRRRRLRPDEVAEAGKVPESRRTTMHSLRLELEQLEYLAGEGVPVEDLDRLIGGYREVLGELTGKAPEGRRFDLPEALFSLIGEGMQRLLHLEPAGAQEGGVLNPELDFTEIEARYRESGPGIVSADYLLREEALSALRRYLHRSTVWFGYGKARGYCGSYMEDGFGCPLLIQLAAELRQRMPGLLGPHHLNQMWAYIYDQRMVGITAHADPAAVNLNFWITDDDANLESDHGGLVVSRREAPREWDFDDYNNRPDVLEPFVSGEDRVVVPHRCNRMVMFNSNLVHKTDDFAFRPGFTNRRINVTMLFGWR
jgi:Flp pilus assembly protein TadD